MSDLHQIAIHDCEPRLRDEHAFLERQLDAAIKRAEAQDWRGFEQTWESFTISHEQHSQYEEQRLFPAFAAACASGNLETKRLVDEHARIRDEIRFLENESQLPELFIEQLHHLAQLLRAHKEQEERILHPWLTALHAAEAAQETAPDATAQPARSESPARSEEDSWWQNPLRHESRNERTLR